MKLFSKEKNMKNEPICLISPVDGEVSDLEKVPDEAFASGMLGEGFAVKPRGGTVFAPAGGVIGSVSENGHAYSIESEDFDLLVHIGIDTVHLGGAFEPMVKVGQMVAAGQPICGVDFEKIRASGLCDMVILLITENKCAGGIKIQKGSARGGKDIALRIEK